MKKKGFTLVELLAVIAILAILVIVAMPNVLGMFNQAKLSTFVTEVQEYMSTATSTWTGDALLAQGSSIYYSNVTTPVQLTLAGGGTKTVTPKQLDMSGADKEYYIEMDRNGHFKRVIVMDKNYCYDSNYAVIADRTNITTGVTALTGEIEKTSINAYGVWEIEPGVHKIDPADATGGKIKVTGCAGYTTLALQE